MGKDDTNIGKKVREPIRPDDEDILEKLRVKRTVSIPLISQKTISLPQNSQDSTVLPGSIEQIEKSSEIEESIDNSVKEKPIAHKKKQSYPLSPKLVVMGRLPRKKGSSSRSLELLHSLEDEIRKYCTGGDLVLLNYLIKLGLEQVKNSSETIFANAEEL